MDGLNRISPIEQIEKISPRPILIVHGTQDDVVDLSSACALYERAREPKEILIVEGAGHRLRVSERAMDGALNWLKERFFED